MLVHWFIFFDQPSEKKTTVFLGKVHIGEKACTSKIAMNKNHDPPARSRLLQTPLFCGQSPVVCETSLTNQQRDLMSPVTSSGAKRMRKIQSPHFCFIKSSVQLQSTGGVFTFHHLTPPKKHGVT